MPANRRKIDTNKLSQNSLHGEANLLFLMVLCLNQTQRDKKSMHRELGGGVHTQENKKLGGSSLTARTLRPTHTRKRPHQAPIIWSWPV